MIIYFESCSPKKFSYTTKATVFHLVLKYSNTISYQLYFFAEITTEADRNISLLRGIFLSLVFSARLSPEDSLLVTFGMDR